MVNVKEWRQRQFFMHEENRKLEQVSDWYIGHWKFFKCTGNFDKEYEVRKIGYQKHEPVNWIF